MKNATYSRMSRPAGSNQRGAAPVHRTTIAAPRGLVDEARLLGEREGLTSFNAVVEAALREYTASRQRAAFAAAMREMGRDPEVVRASDELAALFSATDADGLA